MRLIAELTMPNIGSWNGKWSGENNRHTKIFSTSKSNKMDEFIGNYLFNFGDGWSANVEVRKPLPKEKVSDRFCGYDWMIASIKKYKKIVIQQQSLTR